MNEIVDIDQLPYGSRDRIHDALCRQAMGLPYGKAIVVDRKVYLAIGTGVGYRRSFPGIHAFTRGGKYYIARKVAQ